MRSGILLLTMILGIFANLWPALFQANNGQIEHCAMNSEDDRGNTAPCCIEPVQEKPVSFPLDNDTRQYSIQCTDIAVLPDFLINIEGKSLIQPLLDAQIMPVFPIPRFNC